MPKQTADYEEQMLRAAELYYYGDYTQAEAAEKLGVTTDFWDWKGQHTVVSAESTFKTVPRPAA